MDMLAIGQDILSKQPYSMLVGAELTAFSPGHAEITLDLGDQHTQHHGFTHGGVLAYLADIALTFAGGSVLQDVLTLELKINYLRPAVGQKLVARAEVLSHGKSQAVTRCDIFSVDEGVEKLCAAAQGTIAKRPAAPK